MSLLKAKLRWFGHLMAVFASFLLLFPGACLARHRNQDCGSTFCGHLNISYPFRLENQPPECGVNRYELKCESNNRTTLVLKDGKFFVQEISYGTNRLHVVDASLDTDNCVSLPRSPFVYYTYNYYPYYYDTPYTGEVMFVLNCTKAIKSSVYIDASRCTTESNTSSNSHQSSYFYFLDGRIPPSEMDEACTVEVEVPIKGESISGNSTLGIYDKLSEGFSIFWKSCDYLSCSDDKVSFQDLWSNLRLGFSIYLDSLIYFPFNGTKEYNYLDSLIYCPFNGTKEYNYFPNSFPYVPPERTYTLCLGITGGVIILRTSVGILCSFVLVIYKWRRRHLSADDKIEEFLQTHNLAPIRYSFKEIKKMSRNFKDKLGEGGYGSVFKGKLRSGHHVAVKLLGKSKGNDQDFISEVASIGRIHHANVVKLGFCVERSKQALVYDFMSNGSLDKIIFREESKNSLGWRKMFNIVLGVARGIDFLHQGCDMQILHFDIKPHNILLDESFNPKVSDFGLAKLYSVDYSIVFLTMARGTIGYIAPELVYKNLGGVSYKADVYSFGMLLMEMIGRKNLNAFADHSSQIYFPSWIYDRLDQGEDLELGDASDEESITVRKMLIAAFWCIQLQPTDRPSMNKVLKMLETDIELLEMSRKPFYQLPLESSVEVYGGESSSDELTTSSLDAITIASSNVV